MEQKFYLVIKGTKQGTFKGGSHHHHHDGIEVGSFSFGTETPLDDSTGQASGKRRHNPLKIVKETGAASPQMLYACVTNEVLQSVSIQFVKTSSDGKESVDHTIELTNALVKSIKPSHSLSGALCEEVILVFENSSANSAAHRRLRHAIFLEHVA